MNDDDTTYYPRMKTAVSSFRFQRITLKKRLDEYQRQHDKTLREISQNQQELTRSLSLESGQSFYSRTSDRSDGKSSYKILSKRKTRSLFAGSEIKDSNDTAVDVVADCDGQESSDSMKLCNKYEERKARSLSFPTKSQSLGKIDFSILPTKPRSSRFHSSSIIPSNVVAESSILEVNKKAYFKTKKVLKRQTCIENSQDNERRKSLTAEQARTTMIIADQEHSLPSTKVNKDALKDQNYDKNKLTLTEISQQTTDKHSVNSSEDDKKQTAENNDKKESISKLFTNKNPLPAVSKQNANYLSQAEVRDSDHIRSVNDISRTILEPPVIIKQRLRSTRSLSPVNGGNNTPTNPLALHRTRSKTLDEKSDILSAYSEDFLTNEQVQFKTKKANINDQYWKGCYRNAWSEIDDNFTEKRLSTSTTPSLKISRKQEDVKNDMLSIEVDKTLSSEMKDTLTVKSQELCKEKKSCTGDEIDTLFMRVKDRDNDDIPEEKQMNVADNKATLKTEDKDHASVAANQISENDSVGNFGFPKAKGWRKLRAIPLTRLQEIKNLKEAERNLPAQGDFRVRDSTLPDKPARLMSFRQVALAAIKKDELTTKTSRRKIHEGQILISKERMNEIQQPTESFLRQTVDKRVLHYLTHAHAPRPPTEDKPKTGGPEFHAVVKGIQGLRSFSDMVNANRSLRAEKIRKKSNMMILPHSRTQDVMANGQKTMREMMDEVKDCRYLRNRDNVT